MTVTLNDRRRSPIALAVLAVAIALGACGEPGTLADFPEEPAPRATAHTAEPPATDVHYGGDGGRFMAMPEVLAAREEFVAECMEDEGFEYIPVNRTIDDPVEVSGVGLFLPQSFDLDEALEEAGAIGLGMFDPGATKAYLEDQTDGPINPNDELVQSMTPEERAAYYDALVGDLEASKPYLGCWQFAQQEYPDPSISGIDADMTEQLLVEFESRFDADPRVAAASKEFSECLSAAGIETNNPVDHLKERFAEVTGFNFNQVADQLEDTIPPTDLERLRAEERAVAEANAHCSAAFYETTDQVGREIEQAVIDANPEASELFGVSD